MIWFATICVVVAYVVTALRDRCPKHSDVFDTMVCPLCSIRLLRQAEIDAFVLQFEQGKVPTFEEQPS